MSTSRVYADFQNLDDANRLRLTCAGTVQNLQRQEIQLQEGLVLTFYSDDADDQRQPDELRVEGVVHYDTDGQCWVATVDWATLRHASEERAMTPVAVRAQLTDALRLDLVGPGEVLGAESQTLGDASEILPQRPSTWYLTGFLVPLDADPEQKIDAQSADELDEGSDVQGLEDAVAPEPAAARVRYLPSSMGASLLVPADAQRLRIIVRWGDYTARTAEAGEPSSIVWARTPREEEVLIDLPETTTQPTEHAVPASGGLVVAVSVRPVLTNSTESGLPAGTRSVSVFLVNRRTPKPDDCNFARIVAAIFARYVAQ